MCTLPLASPPSLTLPPTPPGAPHSASSPAWAGPRPEGLHQRSCSVSSADQWSEAAALAPGMQDPVKRQRRAAEQPFAAWEAMMGWCPGRGERPTGALQGSSQRPRAAGPVLGLGNGAGALFLLQPPGAASCPLTPCFPQALADDWR